MPEGIGGASGAVEGEYVLAGHSLVQRMLIRAGA